MNIWDTCKSCGGCCHAQLLDVIELTLNEKKFFNAEHFLCTVGKCSELTDTGCKHGLETRPTVCRMYPFIYVDGEIGIDMTCPIAPTLLLDIANGGEFVEVVKEHRKTVKELKAIGDPVLEEMNDFWTDAGAGTPNIIIR